MTDAWNLSHSAAREWRSGPWALELRGDEIADLTFDGRRVLRSVRAVVRDRDWNTARWVVEDVIEGPSTLELLLHSEGCGAELRGTVRVDASADLLAVSFDTVSTTPFETNRTGLVVLHPPQVAGRLLAVTHSDASIEASVFPSAISPHQPAMDIAGLEWDDDGLAVDVRFTGDVFEMEDQRNWTDASFKTYSRPLALPFPYTLAEGERVRQMIAVRVRPVSEPAPRADPDRLELTEVAAHFPSIAVGASMDPGPAPSFAEVASTLLVEVDLAAADHTAVLARAASAERTLDVRVVVDAANPQALDELAAALRDLRVVRVGAFDPVTHITDAETAASLRVALDRAGLELPVVGGSRAHFTELNREQARIPHGLDAIVFSTTPLFHDLTTQQLVESLAMQRLVAEQAVDIAAGAPVHIGPVTLRPRFNNVATSRDPHPIDDDERMDAAQLAAWTVASAAAVAVPGVASICYFEEWGRRGAVRSDGSERPVAEALRALSALSGLPLLSAVSPDGLVWAIGARRDETAVVLAANLDTSDRDITVAVGGAEIEASLPSGRWREVTTGP